MENLKTSLQSLSSQIQETIRASWNTDDFAAHFKQISEHTNDIQQGINAVGDLSMKIIKNDPETESLPEILPAFICNFLWSEQAKSFLLLWRDIVFQSHKALVFHKEGKAQPDDLAQLKSKTKSAILAAAEELDQFPARALDQISAGKKSGRAQLDKWLLQHNPWPTYKAQLAEIPEQCKTIFQQQKILGDAAKRFGKIIDAIQVFEKNCRQEVNNFRKISEDTIAFIEENKDHPTRISNHISQLEKKIELPDYFGKFTKKLEKYLSGLDDEYRPYHVEIEDGILLFKEFNLQKDARQWHDSEILPILFEHWEVTESIFNAIKIALVNIRNRSVLLSGDLIENQANEDKTENLCQPLQVFISRTAARKEGYDKLADIVTDRLQKLFLVSEIFQPHDSFLTVPLQSTLKQFRSNQNKLFLKASEWLSKQQNLVTKWKSTIRNEEVLSLSEKVVRFVRSRSVNLTNNQYAGIFLTKGYIGESFWVGRQQELVRVENLIRQWEQGFRGAVVIDGKRQAGKSLFGDLVANRFFADNFIRLQPNSTIEVQGRILTLSGDLEEALDFIVKNAFNQKPLIWIDDLELWQDNNFSLSKNVRALCQHIDKNSNRFFFLVSTNKYLLNLLDKTHEIRRIFHVEINLDKMTQEEVRQAILIRHGATHKTLLNDDEKEINAAVFNKLTRKIYQLANGNIGEALYLWVTAIQQTDDENVRFQLPEDFIFPDFIRPDNAILLKTIFLEKRTSEYRLRKLFGSPFKEKYSTIVRRLINLGLLYRHQNGDLEISGTVSSEIGKLLEQHKYLTF